MAELKKNAIKKAIRSIEKSYDYHSYNGKTDVLVDLDELVDLIVSITTLTTEAEIREKAIDEFAEKLRRNFRDIGAFTGYEVKMEINELAEQLKEE